MESKTPFSDRCEREDEEDRVTGTRWIVTETGITEIPVTDKLSAALDLLMDLKAEGRIESWHITFPERKAGA